MSCQRRHKRENAARGTAPGRRGLWGAIQCRHLHSSPSAQCKGACAGAVLGSRSPASAGPAGQAETPGPHRSAIHGDASSACAPEAHRAGHASRAGEPTLQPSRRNARAAAASQLPGASQLPPLDISACTSKASTACHLPCSCCWALARRPRTNQQPRARAAPPGLNTCRPAHCTVT